MENFEEYEEEIEQEQDEESYNLYEDEMSEYYYNVLQPQVDKLNRR